MVRRKAGPLVLVFVFLTLYICTIQAWIGTSSLTHSLHKHGQPIRSRRGLRSTTHLAVAYRKNSVRSSMSMKSTSSTDAVTTAAEAKSGGGRSWPLWFVLPIAPYSKRKTIMREVVPGKIWTFDQMQGILYVLVPVRMTIVKLEGGGLFVYAPVAPTQECVRMVKELEAIHGPVKHVVLPTLAIEHKVFAGPFSRAFPKAQPWVMPGQYSFPVNGLPLEWLGFGFKSPKKLPKSEKGTPWEGQFEHTLLGPLVSRDGIGAFGEATFFIKDTQTLLVTDVVIQVDDSVPEIIDKGDPRALLFHARDSPLDKVEDSPSVRAKGWRRIQQFGLFFQPSSLDILPLKENIFETAPKSPMKELGWNGIFPFVWGSSATEKASYQALKGGLIVAPILQTLILNRKPKETLAYANVVAKWPIKRLISCHLGNYIPTSGSAFRKAFAFLEEGFTQPTKSSQSSSASLFGGMFGSKNTAPAVPLMEDLKFLYDAEKELVKSGTLFPAEPKVKKSASRQ